MYLRTNYQESILDVFGITLPQLNNIYSILGIVFVAGYIPSGFLSDKFSAKKLLSISLAGTALGGFWFAQVPHFSFVVVVFAIWGVFSVFTFWSAHLKLVKLLSTKEEEGRFFGILDGGRGVVEAVLASVALFIFSQILGGSVDLGDKRAALVAVIYMYSAVLAVVAVLVWFLVDEDSSKSGERAESERFRLADIPAVLKNKYLYVHGAIIFLGYAVFWTVYYIGGFLETNIKIDPVTVGTVTVIVLWMRPLGGVVGGILADKVGKTNTIMMALAGAAASLVAIAVLPATMAPSVFFAGAVVLGFFLYAIRGTYWSILGDDGFKVVVMGSAIGVISLIGYMPDILLPQFNSFLFDTFGDTGGYNAYFLSSAALALIGIVFALVYKAQHRAAARATAHEAPEALPVDAE
ncbi:MFS transporter [Actinotalea lenta]|uniref:MFS transporter n=1 Tax=Actinotalea lenta TaxID=3064654 RepID=UPI003312F872